MVVRLLEPWLDVLVCADVGAFADVVVKARAVETEVSIDVVELLVVNCTVIEDVAGLECVCEESKEKLDQELEERFIDVVVDAKDCEVEVDAAETVELPIEVCTLIEDVFEREN